MYFFSGDCHYGHFNIIRYCARPFSTAQEMNDEIIRRHNEVVKDGDVVIHVGDFSFQPREKYVRQLNGSHVFLRGNHDHKNDKFYGDIWERTIEGQKIVCSHYSLRVWNASHYNSWNLYGHSHGKLPPIGKSWDVGVDNNNFYPVSFTKLTEIMANRPDNSNLIAKRY